MKNKNSESDVKKKKTMDSTTLKKEFDQHELNNSDTQRLKIDSILQRLQFKIPSIHQGLKLTDDLDKYIQQIDHRHYGQITDSNYYVLKNNKKITLNIEEWGLLETYLIKTSNEDINMSFRKNELDKSLYKDIYDNLKILLNNPNELSEFLLGFNCDTSDTNIKIIHDVVCGTFGELIKHSLEKEEPIVEIIMRLRLGENIFSSISSLNIKNIGKELKNYLNLKCNKNIKDLVENISILHEKLIKSYPYMTKTHVIMILLII